MGVSNATTPTIPFLLLFLQQVHLQTPATYAELTACDSHAGYHRYTFEPQASANGSIILFAMSHTLNPPAGKGANASITYDSATGITTVSGWVRNAGDLTGRNNGRGIDMFLVAEIKSGFQSFGD